MKLDYTADIYGIVHEGKEYVKEHFKPTREKPCYLPFTGGECMNPTCRDILWVNGTPYCSKAVRT